VILCNGGAEVVGYIEKPTYDYSVSMGIYIFEPHVVSYIPRGEHLDFPNLVHKLLGAKEKVVGYPFDGYWQDLGRPDDYEQANIDFERMRDEFLTGGITMEWKVALSDIDFGPEEKDAVMRVLEKGWLAMGEETQLFEQEFAKQLDVQHAIAVTNGTASLHLACLALGLKPGDEVIVPSLTFVATANAILYAGGVPVFADITSEDNLNISPESIREKITDRTRAIMIMHYGGYPCDMPAILEIARAHDLFVIEDAAHAPGADIDGRKIGGWGEIASFSFFPNKNMTTGEGGMLTTNDTTWQKKCEHSARTA
jgi:hypothetical protein